jgi:VCBS repeat-containing protein
VEGAYGLVAMQADGTWTYTLKADAPDADVVAGGQAHDVFSYTVSDGHGGYATAHLDILVHGDGHVPDGSPGTGTPGGL